MSTSAIEAMQSQYESVIDDSPFSEAFTLDPDDTAISFNGIFDNPYQSENDDAGHMPQNQMMPNIMVSEILSGFTRGAIVQRDSDLSTWKISKSGKDENGVPVIWLY